MYSRKSVILFWLAETSKEPLEEDSTKPQGEEQSKPEEGGGDQPQSTEKTDDKGEEAAAVEVTAEVTVEAEANKGMVLLVVLCVSPLPFPF